MQAVSSWVTACPGGAPCSYRRLAEVASVARGGGGLGPWAAFGAKALGGSRKSGQDGR